MKTTIDHWAVAEMVQPEAPLSPQPGTSDESITGWLSVFYNHQFLYGAVLLTFSAGLFLGHDWLMQGVAQQQNPFTWFVAQHCLSLVFGVMVLTNGGFAYFVRHNRRQQASVWLSLLLWWLSAFALNREMAIFDQSVPWLTWVITGGGLLMVVHTWADLLPRWGQQLLYAGLAGTWLLVVYQAVYLAELYPISLPGLFLLGISFHTYVPGLMAIVLGRQLWMAARQRTYLRGAVLSGLVVPLLLLVVFLTSWRQTTTRLNSIRAEATLRQTSDLPNWVQMAQYLIPGPLTDRLLKVNSVYGTNPWNRSIGSLSAHDDLRLHDPLVVIAQTLFPVPAFAGDEQAKLLRTVSEQHYGTESKLWNGRNLTTQQVATQVKLWPQYRLAYTEKTIWVQSGARWGNREALYTFHLPEGSAVSAMSLWIDGHEKLARLTTQGKAAVAYHTIVGVESRDPSLVTWQEGNRITVRVFPVLPGKNRQVKIGITSPLRAEGDQLVYQNPWFEGPDATSAQEVVKLTVDIDPVALQLRGLSGGLENRTLTQQRAYQPDWSVQLTAPPISPDPFRLAGNAYHMVAYRPVYELFKPVDVYVDVNAAWGFAEFETAYYAARKQQIANVWVFDDGLIRLSPDNLEAEFSRLSAQRFSLFPVYRIVHPATALLVTKGTPTAPTLSDLAGSPFAQHIVGLAQATQPIRTFWFSHDDSNHLSPYLKTLQELGVLTVWRGTAEQYQHDLMTRHHFPTTVTTPDQIVLANAGVVINHSDERQSIASQSIGLEDGAQKANLAPDHLLRLFTYNQLMHRLGRHYFDATYREDSTLAAVAQVGHVVSPVSSLLVLETQKDYTRFGIKKDKTGLDNATLKQDGAVPEPHEWAMLVVMVLLVGWFYTRSHA